MKMTWNDLANEYDKHNVERRARTLPMDAVWAWAESRTDLFYTDKNGVMCRRKESKK